MEELLTPAEMALVDKLANNETALIDAAGRAVARAIKQRFAPCRVLVLAGPGNNGADGRAAARHLAQEGWPVRVLAAQDATLEDVVRAELVIDAILGAGLSRDFTGHGPDLLRAARRIVAIDVPSGLDGATGAVRGYAPQAALTVTFFRLKPGHLLFPGRALCGESLVRDIGIPASVLDTIKPSTWRNGPWGLPEKTLVGNKYAAGDVTVLSGHMPGAARLACGGARRAGAGMVTLAVDDMFICPEAGLIISTAPLATLLEDKRRTTFVIGPGMAPDAAARALAALTADGTRHIIADAGALTACAGAPEKLRGAAIITPHEGEFTRVFGPITTDKLTAARQAATQINAVVVLKGPDTVIAAPNGDAFINNNAPPWLATGGTGDVLAGIIAALLAQGMTTLDAAAAGVWLHGEAALKAGPGMVAEDLLNQV